jgi:hypothetical protein
MHDPTGVGQDPAIAGVSFGSLSSAQRLEIGAMQVNGSLLLALSFYRRRDAVALRQRIECRKGTDSWVTRADCDVPAASPPMY